MDKGTDYLMIKGAIQKDGKILVNLYVPVSSLKTCEAIIKTITIN